MTSERVRATVFLDADNTLWDTDQVFASAQLGLLDDVEARSGRTVQDADRLAFVRAIDQTLAERHHDGLRYPPTLLVRAIGRTLEGEAGAQAAKQAWLGQRGSSLSAADEDAIVADYFGKLKATPDLRPGVAEGMAQLRDAGCFVLIVTEAALKRTEATAALLGLEGSFNRVIEGRKRPELYRRVLKLAGAPENAFMIGDQLDRDIVPAKAAGLTTIFFPGGFQPRWLPEEQNVRPDHRIARFDQALPIIMAQG
jgi:putative hydrolase of the HAD superfamily